MGFEVGLGEWVGKPTVYTLRPLYLTPAGVKPSQTFGLAQGRQGKGKNAPKSKVTRTVTVQAKPGYAVGAVFLDTGLNIDAIAVNFMKIQGTSLDPTQEYTDDWVGGHQDKKPHILSCGGDPIVGVAAREDDVHVMALGLIRMRPAQAEAAPAAPSRKPDARPGGPPAPEAAPKADDPARQPQKAEPPAEAQAPPAAPADSTSGGDDFPWLPLAVFGVVSVSFFAGAMLFLRLRDSARRKQEEDDADRPRKRRRRRRRDDDDERTRPESDDLPDVLPVSDEQVPEEPNGRPTEGADTRIATDRVPDDRAKRRRERDG